ncbi:MAG: DUF308 domain-containing protein [Mycobacterium sp.]
MSDTRPHSILDFVHSTTRHWWWLLIAGVAWIVIAVMILRFNLTTVATVAILFGIYCLVAAANEVGIGAVSSSGWRIVHWLIAALFTVIGVFAFVRPGDTFVSLAAVMSFYFVVRGALDIAKAISASNVPGWWVLLLAGLAELGIGFWAAGSWNVSVVVLVTWVAAGAMIHGIGEVAGAFMARSVDHDISAVRAVAGA